MAQKERKSTKAAGETSDKADAKGKKIIPPRSAADREKTLARKKASEEKKQAAAELKKKAEEALKKKEMEERKREKLNNLATTLSKCLADYEELYKHHLDSNYPLKKPRYEYRELSDELLKETKIMLAETETVDFMKFHDIYNRLLILCFSFNTEIIKAVSGREFSIKPIAGKFLTKISMENPRLETGTILFITLNGTYIGNTTLKFLDDCADLIKAQGINRIICPRLKEFLAEGGITPPGEGFTPFRDDKKAYIESIIKKLE